MIMKERKWYEREREREKKGLERDREIESERYINIYNIYRS